MALPHYKLHTPQQTLGMEAFPVVMVPGDVTTPVTSLKNLLFSRKIQAIAAVVSMAAIATALWIYFEPNNVLIPAKMGNSILLASLVVAGISLTLLVFAAIQKFRGNDSFRTPPETLSLLASREMATTPAPVSPVESVVAAFEQHKRLACEQANAVEFSCEDFVSEPFIEFLDESVIAELFSDEMIAPDCLVFSIEVKENVTQ